MPLTNQEQDRAVLTAALEDPAAALAAATILKIWAADPTYESGAQVSADVAAEAPTTDRGEDATKPSGA